MTEHITADQWMRFYSGSLEDQERLRILRHAAECAQCRKLMEKADDLRFALQRRMGAGASAGGMEAEEYRAVAGSSQQPGNSRSSGYIAVPLIREKDGYFFSGEVPESAGTGNMYALNLSEDRRCLLDDGDALAIRIQGDCVLLQMRTDPERGYVHLLSEQSGTAKLPLAREVRLDLPPSGWCELEIVFGEE